MALGHRWERKSMTNHSSQNGSSANPYQEWCIEQLSHPESIHRWMAVSNLALHGLPNAIPAIRPLLDDTDQTVRFEALRALVRLGDRERIPVLRGLLLDKDKMVRCGAASTLGEVGDVDSIQTLRAMLFDSHPYPRSEAAGALGSLGDIESIPILRTLASPEQHFDVRAKAVEALGKLATPEDSESIAAIRTMLFDDWYLTRLNAAKALAQLRDTESIPTIRLLLDDESGFVRGFAASALACLKDTESASAIQPLLNDDNPVARALGVEALGDLGSTHSVQAIQPMLDDEEWIVRRSGAYALGRLGDRQSASTLQSILRGDDSLVKPAAAHGLMMLNLCSESVTTFLATVRDPKTHAITRHKQLAQLLITSLAKQWKGPENHARNAFIACLLEVLFDPSRYLSTSWPVELSRFEHFQSLYAPTIEAIQLRAGQAADIKVAMGTIVAELISHASRPNPFCRSLNRLFSPECLDRSFRSAVLRDLHTHLCDPAHTRSGRKDGKRGDYIHISHVGGYDLAKLCTDPSDDLANKVKELDLMLMWSVLVPSEYEVVYRIYFQSESLKKIASDLRVTEKTVYNRHRRALEKLRRALARLEFNDD